MDFVLEILGDSRELIRTSFAQNLLQLSLDCQVTLSKGELSLKNALPVSDIRQRLTELGIRVPNECRKDAYDIFRYLRKHGSSYLALHQAVDVRSGESTLDEG